MIQFDAAANPLGPRLGRVFGRVNAAASRSQRSQAAVAVRLFEVWRRSGIRPGEALALGLADPTASMDRLSAVFSKYELMAIQNRLNPVELASLTEDKSIFYPYCESIGVPVPKTIAVVAREGGWIPDAGAVIGRDAWIERLAAVLPATFVTKPARGTYGEAVSAWGRDGDAFVDHRGTRHTAAGLYDALVSHHRYDRFVVQERLENHADIVRLTGTRAVQTLRVATFVEPGGHAHVLCTEWKLIIGANVIDNYRSGATGNLIANVARDTGLLAKARKPSPDGVGWVALTDHPATGLPLEGAQLPDWPAFLALVRRAAQLFLPLRTIGWDVALTSRGPVIVEGNRWWDPLNDAALGPLPPGVDVHPLVAGAAMLRKFGAAANAR